MKPLSRRQSIRATGALVLAAGFASAAWAATQTTFTVTIHNVATDATLKLPDARTRRAPIAPGVYAVAQQPNVLFMLSGYADKALERLAEDGNFQPLLDKVSAISVDECKSRRCDHNVGGEDPGRPDKPADQLSLTMRQR